MDKLTSDKAISTLPLEETKYRSKYEDSFAEISHQLTVDAGFDGSYGDFSGSVQSRFDLSKHRTEKSHFMKIFFNVSGNVHVIDSPNKVLNPDFVTALATRTPNQLFDEYGTHLINRIIIGGRAE